MSGYTPVFGSIFTGTLCGKYPDTAAWLFFLALADKNGVVDMTPQYISSVTGMPVEELADCIERFEKPDPHSRSSDEDGRRLVRVDPNRPWGWRIVNHGRYREKARLMSKSEREVSTGANATRMGDRRRPPETAADPLSDSDAYTNANKEENKSGASAPLVFPNGFAMKEWGEWIAHRKTRRFPCDHRTLQKQIDLLAKYGHADQTEIMDRSINAGWQGLFPPKGHVPAPSTWMPPPDEETDVRN